MLVCRQEDFAGVSLGQWNQIVATWFWCGRVPKSPGTVGSVAALVFLPVVISSCSAGLFLFAALLAVGMKAVGEYLEGYPGVHDPKEVVIDEVCGQLLVFVIVLYVDKAELVNLQATGTEHNGWPLIALSGLVAFRVYDIIKPWPVDAIDRNVRGAAGIMLDDIAAAIPASITTLAVISASMM